MSANNLWTPQPGLPILITLGKQIVKIKDLISGIQVWLIRQIIFTPFLTVNFNALSWVGFIAPFERTSTAAGVLLPKGCILAN